MENNMLRQKLQILLPLLFAAGGATLICGLVYLHNGQLHWLLYTMLGLWITLVLFALTDLRYGFIHLIFYGTIFLFLMSRPTMDWFRTGKLDTYQADAYRFSFIIVMVSLVCLTIGGQLAKLLMHKRSRQQSLAVNRPMVAAVDWILILQKVSFWSFMVTYPFLFIRVAERLLFRLTTTYYNYYASFTSRLPYFTYLLSVVVFYSLCIYLSTRPAKKWAVLVLGLYIIPDMMYLVIGTRNPFILTGFFILFYFFVRNQEEIGKWIGCLEKTVLLLATPVLVLLMGILNYVRDGVSAAGLNIPALFADFVYKQGTSFGVLARGYLYNKDFPFRDFRNYSFGPIIDYFSRGNLGRLLFDTAPFTTTNNSLEMGIYSNSYAHNLSFVVIRNDYLAGHGLGGSYMMDLYSDYGWWGVIIGNVVLGMVFVWMLNSLYRHSLIGGIISLMIIKEVFFYPRSDFASGIMALFTVQFWTVAVLLFAFSYGLARRKTNLQGI